MNSIIKEDDFCLIDGKLFCDNCHILTNHYTKPTKSNGKTFCYICNNMTGYTSILEAQN